MAELKLEQRWPALSASDAREGGSLSDTSPTGPPRPEGREKRRETREAPATGVVVNIGPGWTCYQSDDKLLTTRYRK